MQREKQSETAQDKKEERAVPFFARYLETQNPRGPREKGKPTTQKHPSDKEDSLDDTEI
jgi:hypothetical protein